ncbi:transporter [Variovorax ureilyticus]|uniref:transporter n=1 Tax=Variovorax ureilyticus TaxID=1836198 RepID=UPI003D676ACC
MQFKLHHLTPRMAGLALASMVFSGAAHAADDNDGGPPITPYRPSVSSPAQLPAPGQLELELGGQHRSDSQSLRNSAPYLLKLAFDDKWGLLVGGEAHVWQSGDIGRSQGVGDTVLTLKRAWVVDDATAFGMEFDVKLPTANDVIGSGKTDYTINTIVSRDFGPVHMDANLNATQLGQADPGSSRTQIGASTAFSTSLSGPWGLTGRSRAPTAMAPTTLCSFSRRSPSAQPGD